MAETIVPGLINRETEFVIAGGVRRFGTCGPCALHVLASNARGALVSTADVYTLMRAHGLCDDSGASTIGGLAQAATLLGLTPVAQQGYGEPWSDWQTFFNAHAGVQPFLFETANGKALVDSISGLGENATNLQYHYVAVLGRHTGGFSPRAGKTLPPGYWCCDGDNYAGGNSSANNFNAANVLQFYPDTVIAAARPCAALAVKGAAQVADNTAGLGSGILDYVRAHNIGGASLIPGGENDLYAGAPNGERIAAFADNDIVYWNGKGVVEGVTADVVAGLWKANNANHAQVVSLTRQAADVTVQRDAATAQIAPLNTKVSTLNQTVQQQQLAIAQLTAQLQAAQQQPPVPAAPTLQEALQIVFAAALPSAPKAA